MHNASLLKYYSINSCLAIQMHSMTNRSPLGPRNGTKSKVARMKIKKWPTLKSISECFLLNTVNQSSTIRSVTRMCVRMTIIGIAWHAKSVRDGTIGTVVHVTSVSPTCVSQMVHFEARSKLHHFHFRYIWRKYTLRGMRWTKCGGNVRSWWQLN